MKIKVFAKINFSLTVNGKREDGYHLIDTVMHSVNLYDIVNIEKANKIEVLTDGLNQESNIAYKAAKLFFEKADIDGGANIQIEKNIPFSAGLGGGSADAAAVLVGLNKLYGVGFSNEMLCEIAVKLGADVPFFIQGGCMRCQGIGEVLTPAAPLKDGYILLAKGDTKPSTAEMYRRLDEGEINFADTEKVLECIKNNDIYSLGENLYNAFETVWPNSIAKDALLKTDALAVALTGSGPTFFALFDDYDKVTAAFNKVLSENIPCYICEPQNVSMIIE